MMSRLSWVSVMIEHVNGHDVAERISSSSSSSCTQPEAMLGRYPCMRTGLEVRRDIAFWNEART